MKTVIYPDMIEAAFAANEIDLLNTWIIFKTLDQRNNGGQGFFSKEDTFDILMRWPKISKATAYRMLTAGDGVYWKIASDKVYLRGIAKICEHLQIRILNKRGLEVDLENLCLNKAQNRSYLMGVLVAGSGTPQSYSNIAERCNISRRTVISYLHQCSHLKIIPNYTIKAKSQNRPVIMQELEKMREANPREAERYQLLRDRGGYYVGYRLPNSFASELKICRTKTKKQINKKIGEGNPGIPVDWRGNPLNDRTFDFDREKKRLKNTPQYFSYKATVREVIVGENNVRDEMRIWSDEES